MELKKFVISPPFGNYISHSKATSVAGSFTVNRRWGLIKQSIKTIRPIDGGWVNKIGLRNKGIRNVKFKENKIYSIAALEPDDWKEFHKIIPDGVAIEINLGCPNAMICDNIHRYILTSFVRKCSLVSVKMPPTSLVHFYVEMFLTYGVKYFHMCNTIPTERGGESGKRLKERSLQLISGVRKEFGNDFNIIGGGGIYTPEDIKLYEEAGANHFSLSTAWFAPRKAIHLLQE